MCVTNWPMSVLLSALIYVRQIVVLGSWVISFISFRGRSWNNCMRLILLCPICICNYLQTYANCTTFQSIAFIACKPVFLFCFAVAASLLGFLNNEACLHHSFHATTRWIARLISVHICVSQCKLMLLAFDYMGCAAIVIHYSCQRTM